MRKSEVVGAILESFKKMAHEELVNRFLEMKDFGDRMVERNVTFTDAFGDDAEAVRKAKDFWKVVNVLESNGLDDDEVFELLIDAVVDGLNSVTELSDERLHALIQFLLVE